MDFKWNTLRANVSGKQTRSFPVNGPSVTKNALIDQNLEGQSNRSLPGPSSAQTWKSGPMSTDIGTAKSAAPEDLSSFLAGYCLPQWPWGDTGSG